ncbi:undecaprenyl-diphosphatase [Priestia taiwanensis]|uniref:Undecaprenyl-diphosphatase n=1 Tax=Priestia taiwanensis TaxID=1347902 RepID=A0A917ERL3_9BACI|nr:undecaprenyl-diphosphatase [Priestia taiwanensis]MBM7364052.1 undecaprenyl-diphosphatase [Priestia taiwanensis]GGE71226.1 undecaprenyl-diphosphatase [Priestia taiwanensis]
MSLSEVNIELFHWINDIGIHYPAINPVSIFFAEYTLYFLILATLIYWFTRTEKNRMMVIQGGVAFILAEGMAKIAGQFHFHYQPFHVLEGVNKLIDKEINNSFPSDHTILFVSMCVSFWLVRRNAWWLVFASCVAISRILVGVHYPVDIVVGALFGIVSAYLAYVFVPRISFVKRLLVTYEKVEKRVLPVKGKSTD